MIYHVRKRSVADLTREIPSQTRPFVYSWRFFAKLSREIFDILSTQENEFPPREVTMWPEINIETKICQIDRVIVEILPEIL